MQQDTADYIERPVRQLFQYLCSQKVKKNSWCRWRYELYVRNIPLRHCHLCFFDWLPAASLLTEAGVREADTVTNSYMMKYTWSKYRLPNCR